MTVDLATAACRQPGCGGPTSGVCINGLSFDECPDVISADTQMPDGTLKASRAFLHTGSASALSVVQADSFLRANGGVLLALVALPGAGKTTLSSTVYDLVRRGRLEGFGFAGSETLRAFEERCFFSRAASMADAADTARTPGSAELALLHLSLMSAGGRRVELLLSDRSGEHFEEALNRPEEFASLPEFARADAALILVDGERLSTEHQSEFARLRRLVTVLAHTGSVPKVVRLVVTKADRLDDEARVIVERRTGRLLEDVARRLSPSKVGSSFTECRARSGSAEIGRGLSELLAATIPAVESRSFSTTYWFTSEGGTALDQLMHALRRD